MKLITIVFEDSFDAETYLKNAIMGVKIIPEDYGTTFEDLNNAKIFS